MPVSSEDCVAVSEVVVVVVSGASDAVSSVQAARAREEVRARAARAMVRFMIMLSRFLGWCRS